MTVDETENLDESESLDETEILLVEDNPTDAELTMRALKRKNLNQ